jgi:hypothetical protein
MRKQHKALAVVAIRPDLDALMVSPNPSVALQAPVCCGSRTSAGEEVSEKKATCSRCNPGFAPARRTGSPLAYSNLEPGLSLESNKQAKNQM